MTAHPVLAHRGSQPAAVALSFSVESVAFWAPTLPSWQAASAAFAGRGELADPPAARPAPQLLAPAERRRVPDSVALALEVASQAVQASGRDPKTLASIFTSAQGDLAVNDYMCSTLAATPALISPTKFHNSVHNAAAGYWTIATGCMQASTALSGFDASFAAGLFVAASQVAADETPVLLVAFDVQAVGALASVTTSKGLLACALVLAPRGGTRGLASIEASLDRGEGDRPVPTSAAAKSLAGNAMADALPFLEWLAGGAAAGTTITLPLAPRLALRLSPTTPPS